MSGSRGLPVAVVGGGVAGLSLAYALARLGRPVVLYERGRIGRQGASSGPAALLNPRRGHSARAHPDDRAGLAAFWRVAEELRRRGLDPGAARCGVLRIAPNERRAKAWQRLEGAHWLPRHRVPPPFHAPYGALLVEDGGWVRPRTLLAALRTAAVALGAEIREGVRVLRLEPASHAVRLLTSAGAEVASQVVLCVGADASPELPLPPLEAVAGEVVEVDSTILPAPPPFALGGSLYATFSEGTAFVGGNHRDPEVPDPEAPRRLLEQLDASLPGLAGTAGRSLWSGVRARAATPRPLTLALAPRVLFFGALAGRGFLCAADLATAIAYRLTGPGHASATP